MAKLPYIELSNGLRIPILHEDRNVIAIDKPQGWMLAPISWQNTARNLFAALTSSVNAGDFWAKSRSLKFIRFVHRLDADTSGVLLLVKAPGAMPAFTELFEDRKVGKVYLAVVKGVPEVVEWKCRLRLAPMQDRPGRMEINNAQGKDSETLFRVIDKRADRSLVMCWPLTGRTHQIRLHLQAVGHPVWADEIYGDVPATQADKTDLKLGLRSIRMSYKDPFMAEEVTIQADVEAFAKAYGFDPANAALSKTSPPEKALEHPRARFEEKRREEKVERQQKRSTRREEPGDYADRDDVDRGDWRQDEDSGGFAGESTVGRGKSSFRERPLHPLGRGPRDDSRTGGRPPQHSDSGRSFGRQRKFEPRAGGFARKAAGGYAGASDGGRDSGNRPLRRSAGSKAFGGPSEFASGAGGYGSDPRRSYGNREQRGGSDERAGGFRAGSKGRPGFGRPSGNRDPRENQGGRPGFGRPYESRGERRPYGGRGFDQGGDDRGNREGANELRPRVFPSSAKFGLKAGFQKTGGFGSIGGGRRPFRSTAGERSFQGGGARPFKPRRSDGSREGGRPPGKFGGKPAWGKKSAGRPSGRPPYSR